MLAEDFGHNALRQRVTSIGYTREHPSPQEHHPIIILFCGPGCKGMEALAYQIRKQVLN